VLEKSTVDFDNKKDALKSNLANLIFQIEGIKRVFLGNDFVSVSKDENLDWDILKPSILTAIMEHYASGKPVLEYNSMTPKNISEDDNPIIKQIKELIDERVRPAVAMDGGDISFCSFSNGVVTLQMKGACAGCPSSTATLKMGIENMLKHYIPEVEEVRAADL
tara:strand:+ start:100 stop:591 length:492 start_codon:yes stop_codon:yes gene_type:complete